MEISKIAYIMTTHTDLINRIAKKIDAQSYLEIGVYNPDHNFNKIDIPYKIGVDPEPNAKASLCMSSDEYFANFRQFPIKFDICFQDGLHHADQVKRDIENSWQWLNPGGVIVIHDCSPETEEITTVPRQTKVWTGDVYRTAARIISAGKFTVDFDFGCLVLRKNGQPLAFTEQEFTWNQFDKNRKELLNLVSIDEAKKIIDEWL